LFNFDKFKSGGLHEKQAVETLRPSQHFLEDRGKPGTVAVLLASSQANKG
jgi:hypothetical protein